MSVQERPGACRVAVAGSLPTPFTVPHRLFRPVWRNFEREGRELGKETAGCRKQ